MVDYAETAFSMIDNVWAILKIVLAIVMGMVILWVVFVVTKYKHKFRIRELTGGKTRIIDDRAREIIRGGDPLKWRLLKSRINVPVPPAEAIHLTKNGKYSVEAYRTPEGEVKYVIDKGINKETAETFESVTTQDREFYIDEMREAESYIKKNWTEYIMPLAGMFSVIIIIVLMFVFWEDIAKPGIDIQKTSAKITEDQRQITVMLKEIIQQRQIIEARSIPDVPIPTETNNTGAS
jgi:uncharacterized membrane protein